MNKNASNYEWCVLIPLWQKIVPHTDYPQQIITYICIYLKSRQYTHQLDINYFTTKLVSFISTTSSVTVKDLIAVCSLIVWSDIGHEWHY